MKTLKKIYVWIIVAILAIGNVVLGIFLYKTNDLKNNYFSASVALLEDYRLSGKYVFCMWDTLYERNTDCNARSLYQEYKEKRNDNYSLGLVDNKIYDN